MMMPHLTHLPPWTSHLSSPTHGFSASIFGRRFLNPVQTRAEEGYLAERVVLSEQKPSDALKRLSDLLTARKVISITGHQNARRPLLPAFLGGSLTLAPGAPSLAVKTGAALLPVVPLRIGPAHYRVDFAPPLARNGNAEETIIQDFGRQFAQFLEPYVRAYPEQWRGWSHMA